MDYLFDWRARLHQCQRLYALATLVRNVTLGGGNVLNSISTLLGVQGVARWDNVGNPAPAVEVITTSRGKLLLVQGTKEFREWTGQVAGAFQASVPGIPGRVSAFYGTMATTLIEQIKEPLFEGNPAKIVIAGHSYGGGLCLLLGHLLNQFSPGIVEGVASFGAPKVGNRAFCDALAVNHHRVENLEDPVPLLPPRISVVTNLTLGFVERCDYWHHGRGVLLSSRGELYFQDGYQPTGEEVEGPPLYYVNAGIVGFGSHDINEYIRRLRYRFRVPPGDPLREFDEWNQLFNLQETVSWGNLPV